MDQALDARGMHGSVVRDVVVFSGVGAGADDVLERPEETSCFGADFIFLGEQEFEDVTV